MPMRSPEPSFAMSAAASLGDPQLRRTLREATSHIRARRAAVVSERPNWEQLREAARQIKTRAIESLDAYLIDLEREVTNHGGVVHWARDAAEAGQIVSGLVADAGSHEVVKAKSLTTDEIDLNAALASSGINALETDLAELIIQLAGERPSHIVVPAVHLSRAQIAAVFRRSLPGAGDVDDSLDALATAARLFLREKFLTASVAVTGANFAIAETGTIALVESEGNGRMCSALPNTLITVMGIEKVLPRLDDLEVMLQLLAPSATGERMNPYTSLWTGVHSGDGPSAFHLVLVDNGRTDVLADEIGRDALNCIKCGACLNVCPVYERTGGHAYNATYSGPIGAILSPQLTNLEAHKDLPWASTLCGACFDACPVKIDIPSILIHLRQRIAGAPDHRHSGEARVMGAVGWIFRGRRRFEAGQRLARLISRLVATDGMVRRSLPGPASRWTNARDLQVPSGSSFRDWWRRQDGGA